MGLIVLLTDFGTVDPFVGIMRGVIAQIAPQSTVIDLTHEIPPQQIMTAAFHLMVSYSYFPHQTTFCCVVDPGVGTHRRAIAIATEHYFFVAPDNGLLSFVLTKEPILPSVELNNPRYQLTPLSHTFHGRDIFAPAAAYLARGVPIQLLGSSIDPSSLHTLPFPTPHLSGRTLAGSVVAIDHFGNCITSIAETDIPPTWSRTQLQINCNRLTLNGLSQTFGDVPIGEPVAYIGSFGYLELAVRNGNFAQQWAVDVGSPVVIQHGSS